MDTRDVSSAARRRPQRRSSPACERRSARRTWRSSPTQSKARPTSLNRSTSALAEIDETETLISGLKEKEGQFTQRRRAMEERVKRFRSLIEQAMAITDLLKLRRPTATLTLRKLPPDVVVTTEADIPAEFFVPQPPPPPKLDKKALKEAWSGARKRIEFAASLETARNGPGPRRRSPDPRRDPQQRQLLAADQEGLMRHDLTWGPPPRRRLRAVTGGSRRSGSGAVRSFGRISST